MHFFETSKWIVVSGVASRLIVLGAWGKAGVDGLRRQKSNGFMGI